MRAIRERQFWILPWFILGVAACDRAEPEATKVDEGLSEERKAALLIQGKESSDKLMQALGKRLKAAMASGGPVVAIDLCREVAQPMTESASGESKLRVSRIALRVRNPVNGPDDLDREVMEGWVKNSTNREGVPESVILENEDGSVVYYRPLMTEELCLKCHGNEADMEPVVGSLLEEFYPEDEAVGFKEGDLRGAFRVEFPVQ